MFDFNVLLLKPFGDAILTIPFPQVGRAENAVTLWNLNDVVPNVVHSFSGHVDVILDFSVPSLVCSPALNPSRKASFHHQNASRNEANKLVTRLYTLCKDSTLRLWTIDDALQTVILCYFDNGF